MIAAVAVFPLVFTNPTATNFGVVTLIFVAVASAWNLFSGYSGYLSLGHAVFYGTGAYFLVVAANDWHLNGSAVFWLLPLAGVAAAVIAVPLGLVALRVRRHTFVVITIAFFFIAQLSASNLGVTGSLSGLLPPVPNWAPATFNNPFYYLAMILATATVALSWQVRRSRFGLQLRAIRDDEDRAARPGRPRDAGQAVGPGPVRLHHRHRQARSGSISSARRSPSSCSTRCSTSPSC